MAEVPISRRVLLGAALAGAGCGRKRFAGYSGYLFVANRDDRTVAVVNLRRFGVAGRLALDAAPGMVLPHPAQALAYVLAPGNGTLYEVDTAEVRRKIRVAGGAFQMQLSSAGDALWVLCRDPDVLARVRLADFRVAERVRLPAPADSFDLSRDGLVACSFAARGEIGLASSADSAMRRFTSAKGSPCLVRFRSDGRVVLAADRAGRSLAVVDTATGGMVVRLALPLEPEVFCLDSTQGQLFISGGGTDAISVVYPYRTEVAEVILAGKSPGAMAACDTPAYLFAANPGAATVTVLDIDTRKLVAVVGVGREPAQILITPDRQYALVLNRASGDMGVIRVGALASDAEGRPRRYKSAPLFHMVAVGAGPVSGAIVAG